MKGRLIRRNIFGALTLRARWRKWGVWTDNTAGTMRERKRELCVGRIVIATLHEIDARPGFIWPEGRHYGLEFASDRQGYSCHRSVITALRRLVWVRVDTDEGSDT